MAVLYENVIKIILETLKVFLSNILLKKYYSSMRCGLDKKNYLKGDYNWFRLAILPCGLRPITKRKYNKNIISKKLLSVGQLNSGQWEKILVT